MLLSGNALILNVPTPLATSPVHDLCNLLSDYVS